MPTADSAIRQNLMTKNVNGRKLIVNLIVNFLFVQLGVYRTHNKKSAAVRFCLMQKLDSR